MLVKVTADKMVMAVKAARAGLTPFSLADRE